MYKEFYGEPPFHHHHHMGPMEHEHIANAAAYARLNTKLSVHMNDDSRHITDEEREKWNKAADNMIEDIDEILDEIANTSDIPTKMSDLENDLQYITQLQLDLALSNFTSWQDALTNYVTRDQLSNYITRTQLDTALNNLGSFTSMLKDYATKEYVQQYTQQYIKNSDVLFTYNGTPVYKGGSINSGGDDTAEVITNYYENDYVLPAASTSALGGIKIGTVAGNYNYPVKLDSNNVAFVTVQNAGPTPSSETIVEYKPQYQVQVLQSTLRRSKYAGHYVIVGTLQWQIGIFGETYSVYDVSTNRFTCKLYHNGNHQTTTPSIFTSASTNTFSWSPIDTNDITYTNAGDSTNIRVYDENNNLVSSVIVPHIIPGEDGQDGQDGKDGQNIITPTQGLDFEVIRMRGLWTDNPSPAYNNGTVVESGVKYKDVVRYVVNSNDYGYFYCKTAGTSLLPMQGTPIAVTADWEPISYCGSAAFDLLLADSAYINSLTSKQVVVTNTSDQVVGGMVSGTYIPAGLTATNNNGIRIFAGNVPNNGDLASAPFTVDNNGKLRATNADITGSITATTGTFSNGTFSNCVIDGTCTINGTLNYTGVIGNTQTISTTGTIPNDVTFVMLTGGQLGSPVTVRFPANPVQGQTIYIKHDGYALLLPSSGHTAFIYTWAVDHNYDGEGTTGYSYKKRTVNYNYTVSGMVPSVRWNAHDGNIHQYMFSGTEWYELTSGFENSLSI